MELRQLQYFVCLVESGSFISASKKLFISQPTLSWNIKKLEEELEVQLFYRDKTGIMLTKNGQDFFDSLVPILDQLYSLISRTRKDEHTQPFTVGLTDLTFIQFNEIITDFIKRNPIYKTDFIQKGSKEIQRMVYDGELDAGIVSYPVFFSDLLVLPIPLDYAHYTVSVVVGPNNRLSDNKTITLLDLIDENISLVTDEYVIGNVIEERCRELGFSLNIVYRDNNWMNLVNNVDLFDTITLLPTNLARRSNKKNVRWIPLIDDKVNYFKLAFVVNKNKDMNQKYTDFYYEILRNAKTTNH